MVTPTVEGPSVAGAPRWQSPGEGTLRIGLVGFGRMGSTIWQPWVRRTPGVRLVAIADIAEAARKRATSQCPGVPVHETVEALLAAIAMDAVLVATPPATHAVVSVAVLEQGIPVYVEKPLAATLDEAIRVREVQNRSGAPLMVGFSFRRHPLSRRIVSRIARGDIGEVVHVRTLFTVPRRLAPRTPVDESGIGSLLLELGSHHLDLIPRLVGRSVRSIAVHGTAMGTDEGGLCVTQLLAGGVTVESFFAFDLPLTDEWEIRGTGGVLKAVRSGVRGLRCEPLRPDGPGGLLRHGVEAVRPWLYVPAAIANRMRMPWGDPSYGRALQDFIDSVRTGAEPSPGIDEGVESMRILEAARRARDTGTVVDVGPLRPSEPATS